jgi:hypothetical protein
VLSGVHSVDARGSSGMVRVIIWRRHTFRQRFGDHQCRPTSPESRGASGHAEQGGGCSGTESSRRADRVPFGSGAEGFCGSRRRGGPSAGGLIGDRGAPTPPRACRDAPSCRQSVRSRRPRPASVRATQAGRCHVVRTDGARGGPVRHQKKGRPRSTRCSRARRGAFHICAEDRGAGRV